MRKLSNIAFKQLITHISLSVPMKLIRPFSTSHLCVTDSHTLGNIPMSSLCWFDLVGLDSIWAHTCSSMGR